MAKKKKPDLSDGFEKAFIQDYVTSNKDIDYAVSTLADVAHELDPEHWVSTGDDILDLMISNRPNGGLPFGRYLNIYSDSGLGKSLLVAKIMASVQQMGGTAVYFDTERAAYPPFMDVLGVDRNKLIYINEVNTLEKIFDFLVKFLTFQKETGYDGYIVFAVDSMTAVTTETGADLETLDNKGYGQGAEKQKKLGEMYQKVITKINDKVLFITTDQIRDKIGATQWERKWRSTSGWAQKFYSDIRLELTPRAAIKNKNKEVIGAQVNIKTVKNRVAPSPRNTEHFIYFTRGLDNYKSWVENCKNMGIFKTAGAYLKYKMPDGEFYKMTDTGNLPSASDMRKALWEDKELRKLVYDDILEKMIIHYEFNQGFVDDSDETVEEVDEDLKNREVNDSVDSEEKEDSEAVKKLKNLGKK